jgi:hypothetical protein
MGDALLRRVESGHVGLQSREGFERLLNDAGVDVVGIRRLWLGLYAVVSGVKR